MTKAVAVAQGWEYERHEQFNVVLNNARIATGNLRIRQLRGIANDLHGNFYTRKRFLDAEEIRISLDDVADFVGNSGTANEHELTGPCSLNL